MINTIRYQTIDTYGEVNMYGEFGAKGEKKFDIVDRGGKYYVNFEGDDAYYSFEDLKQLIINKEARLTQSGGEQ